MPKSIAALPHLWFSTTVYKIITMPYKIKPMTQIIFKIKVGLYLTFNFKKLDYIYCCRINILI